MGEEVGEFMGRSPRWKGCGKLFAAEEALPAQSAFSRVADGAGFGEFGLAVLDKTAVTR
jgi:hypothetical protein